ncbi:hypothetical protein EI94DRAFT_1823789 [Lactarius quietus]|nr:hypothetical protein EI94DRAFT_1823789 [Lactarius quietus]
MTPFLDYFQVDRFTAVTLVISAGVYLLYIVAGKVRAYLSAPVRDLPGPKSVNWLTGSLPRHIWEPDSEEHQLEWARQYGPNYRFYGWFNMARVVTMDPQALNYILTAPEFEKSDDARFFLGDALGKGWPQFSFI